MKRLRYILLTLSLISVTGISVLLHLANLPANRKSVPERFRWEQFHDGGYFEIDTPRGIVAGPHKTSIREVDKLIFVLGETYNSNDTDVTLRALTPDSGKLIWSKNISYPGSATGQARPDDRAFQLAQTDNHLFALGSKITGDVTSSVSYAGGKAIGFLQKLDKETGELIWTKEINTKLPNESVTDGKLLRTAGDHLLIGLMTYDINTVDYRYHILKVDSNSGDILWENRMLHGRQYPDGFILEKASDGGCYLAGTKGDQITPYRPFITKLDAQTGKEIWRFRFDKEGTIYSSPADFAIAENNVYLLHKGGEAGSLISRLDKDGKLVWTTKFDSGYKERDQPVALLIDDRNDLYACSTCRNSWYFPTNIAACVVKLSSENGDEIWRTIAPISDIRPDNLPIFTQQISAKIMRFNSNSHLEIMGTSWNGQNLDIFKTTINRENGSPGDKATYDGPAGGHDYLVDVDLPYQNYGFVALGMTSRCKPNYKFLKNLRYLLSGGRNWARLQREISTFHDDDPYNYDEVIFRF